MACVQSWCPVDILSPCAEWAATENCSIAIATLSGTGEANGISIDQCASELDPESYHGSQDADFRRDSSGAAIVAVACPYQEIPRSERQCTSVHANTRLTAQSLPVQQLAHQV